MAPGRETGAKGAKSFKKWPFFRFKGDFLGLVKNIRKSGASSGAP
jgi:hypothetical protein